MRYIPKRILSKKEAMSEQCHCSSISKWVVLQERNKEKNVPLKFKCNQCHTVYTRHYRSNT